MKRIISLLTALALLVCMVPTAVFATELASGTCGDSLTWTLDTDGVLTISGTGDMYHYNSDPAPWADYLSQITAVNLPDGLTSVGNQAFKNCTALTSLSIPASVTALGAYCFSGCQSLTELTLAPAEVTVGLCAFSGCTSLPEVTVPEGYTTVGEEMFIGCHSLTTVTLPDSLQTIALEAFGSCSELQTVNLGNGVTVIEQAAFGWCEKLTSIHIPASVTTIDSLAFANCTALNEITFAGSAPEIGSDAFTADTATAYYPNNDATWTADVRQNYGGTITWASYAPVVASGTCGSDLTWELNSDGVLTVSGTGAMGNYDLFYANEGEDFTGWVLTETESVSAYPIGTAVGTTARWNSYRDDIVSVVICDGVTSVGDNAFYRCENLTSVVLADSVTTIGSGAFSHCTALTQIIFTGDAPAISSDAFYKVTAEVSYPGGNETYTADVMQNYGGTLIWAGDYLASGTCGESATWTLTHSGVLTISGAGAVTENPWSDYQASIVSVVIEDGITSLRSGAFTGHTALTDVTMADSVTSVGTGAFQNCTALTNVKLSNSLEQITTCMFYGCPIETVTIPDSVTHIGNAAFYDCQALTSITLPEGITYMASSAFANCYSLTSIDIPAGIEEIPDMAFYDCIKLETVTLPEGLTSIGGNAFYGCCALTTVNIPSTVITIGATAFSASNITELTLPEGVVVEENAFRQCTCLETLTVNGTGTILGAQAFALCFSLKEIRFLGDAPDMEADTFQVVTATAYYPADNETWTADVLENYGGTLTWTSYASVVESGTCGDNLTWELDSNGVLTISGTGAMYDYGASTTTDAPWTESLIKKIVVKEGVTTIGDYAFNGSRNLTDVTLPATLTGIGSYAFSWCNALTGVTLPEGITTLGNCAFRNCAAMTRINIPDSVVSIGKEAFYFCLALEGTQCDNGIYLGDESNPYRVLLRAVSSTATTYLVHKDTEFITSYSFAQLVTFDSTGSEVAPVSPVDGLILRYRACQNLTGIYFQGNAPAFADNAFYVLQEEDSAWDGGPVFVAITTTAYSHCNDATWTEDVRQNYGGTITWQEIHDVAATLVKPTCTEDGYILRECFDCGRTETVPDAAALGHSYENGFCTLCDGYEEPELVDGVYEIYNAGQLYWFANYVNTHGVKQGNIDTEGIPADRVGCLCVANARLMDDITVNPDLLNSLTIAQDGSATVNDGVTLRTWIGIGDYDDALGDYVQLDGEFDGNGKTISGLYINDSEKNCAGLVGYLSSYGVIHDVNVVDSYIHGGNNVGGIAGRSTYCVRNSSYSGWVVGNTNVGGIVGLQSSVWGAVAYECSNSGTVIGVTRVGGIAGRSDGIVQDSCNTGAVTGEESVGGIAGNSTYGIDNCYNTGMITGQTNVGGIAGVEEYEVNNSYYLIGTAEVAANGTGTITDIAVTQEQLASGEVAYKLQSLASEGVWGQTIGTQDSPVLGGATVYTFQDCQGGAHYANTARLDGHIYGTDAVCDLCGFTMMTPANATLSFEDVILVNVYFTAPEVENVAEFGLLTFHEMVAQPSHANAAGITNGCIVSGDHYMVTTEGIAAKNMGDTVYFSMYAKLTDGTYVYSKVYYYSPRTYAYNMLSSASTSASMKSLVVAMLNYGAAAQVYFGYNTDAMVNSGLTEEHKSLVSGYSGDMLSDLVIASAEKKVNFASNTGFTDRVPSITFEGAFSINYYLTPGSQVSGDVTMYIWDAETYDAVQVLSADNAVSTLVMELQADGRYLAAAEGITAKELDNTVYVAAVYADAQGNTYTSGVLAYSIGAYCEGLASGTTTMQPLAQATAVYSYYAKQNFN